VGGVARASGRQLTQWAFALEDVRQGAEGMIALILPPASVATLPLHAEAATGAGRSIARRRVLTALAHRVLAPFDAPPRLVADRSGVRRIDGTRWFASVAERSGWVAAAIAPHAVGIDIENVDEARAARDAILAGVVTIDLAAWHGLAGAWAAREAVLKAMGRGLTSDPGGWRFGSGTVTATGSAAYRVEIVACAKMVAAIAYVGG
jgi:hypothetical protein